MGLVAPDTLVEPTIKVVIPDFWISEFEVAADAASYKAGGMAAVFCNPFLFAEF